MKNYNKELDDLFDDWEKESKKNGLDNFVCDGLMFKGEVFKNKGFYGRKPGNENELWNNSSKRILFLLKDMNDPDEYGLDLREWMGTQNPPIITKRFFKNIALWLLGIDEIQENGNFIPFNEANIPEKYSKAFEEKPFAIVNCKKQAGSANISNEELLDYVEKYGIFLKKQIEILDPNIIYCGGGSDNQIGTVVTIAFKIIYPKLDFLKVNNWIFFNKKKNIILIDGWHPSYRVLSYIDGYKVMMEKFKEFLIKRTEY